ncbi:MAG: D-alanyl-D-alanine carboxypeptidase, partial [Pedobacter sp.]|nr:D-alanyl-D-alanine carboxypeptidase [Pedobacter sp.]
NGRPFRVQREFNANVFKIPTTAIPEKINQFIPYKVSTTNTVNLLMDTLKKVIGIADLKMPLNAKTIFNMKSDSVFREMLLPSDNFIAEHLLLTYADRLGVELNTSKVISHIEKQYLSTLPNKMRWVDGSGLSRGNLFTPRDMITLLELIYNEVNDQKRLFSLLPAGGKSGTLRNAYPKTDSPFVFGKTGSLSNNHNQSGYVVTKKGRVLIFSFMNNNFILPTAEVRAEMVRIMTYIHENF